MKKIIDHVINLPEHGETSRFPSSFASAWMRIEGVSTEKQIIEKQNTKEQTGGFFCNLQRLNGDCCGRCGDGNVTESELGKQHEDVHNLYAVVSGISLMQLDLSKEEHLTPWWGPNTTKLLDNYDDYVKFTMDFAGYAYERFSKQNEKIAVFEAVKQSIDANRPVLVNFGSLYDWFPIIGYDDETDQFYGYDGFKDNWDKSAAEGYEDGMFYLSRWYEEMTEAVVVTGKSTPRVTFDDVFRRMIQILETMVDKGYFKHSAEYLRDNANFKNYDDVKYAQLAERIVQFIGLPIDQRNVISKCFEGLPQVEALKDKWQHFKRITALYNNTHDICWIAWRMVGAFGTAPEDECVKALASPIVRRAIADLIDIVGNNDKLVLSCLLEMMD